MAKRDLYIVAANRKDLYEQLRRQFAGNAGVELILDRRKAERRRGGGVANDPRRVDRRVRDDAHLLKTLGVVLVSIERDEPGPAAPGPAATAGSRAPAKGPAASRPARGAPARRPPQRQAR